MQIYICMYVCMYVCMCVPHNVTSQYRLTFTIITVTFLALCQHTENWTELHVPYVHARMHARTHARTHAHTHTHIHTSVHAYTVMSYLAVSEQSAGEAQQLSFTHGEVLPILLHHRVQLIVQRLDLSAIREEQSPHMHHKVTHFNLSFHPVIDLHYTGTKSVITRTSQSDRS